MTKTGAGGDGPGTQKTPRWAEYLDVLDYAYQPIVNIHTGVSLGYEALLRNVEASGFASIQELLDSAWSGGELHDLDLALRERAILKFLSLPGSENALLFFNLDNRVTQMPGYTPGNTLKIADRFGLFPGRLCFEVSERHLFECYREAEELFRAYQRQGFKVALDDYGSGYAGLKLLYYLEPDFIKVSGFLIQGVGSDPKKRLFVSNLVGLAHTLGSRVVAEGIETEKDFLACCDLGCDLAQGFLIAHPERDLSRLERKYPAIEELQPHHRRPAGHFEDLEGHVERLPALSEHADLNEAFEAFQKNRECAFLPVVNAAGEPVGVLRECDIKPYAYSAYGRDLLKNRAYAKGLPDFLVRCPVAEAGLGLDKAMEVYTLAGRSDGILVTRAGKYLGFLSVGSLLEILNERNLQAARDQNPLTRLPGNASIYGFLSRSLEMQDEDYVYVYFDLDHFKAFNDHYGFRQGDRVIVLFSDILKGAAHGRQLFIGHIGGDDFFAGLRAGGGELPSFLSEIRSILDKFSRDVTSFYKPEDRERGSIRARDRSGAEQDIPLLTVSAAVLFVPAGPRRLSLESLGEVIANVKERAKESPDHLALTSLTEEAGAAWAEGPEDLFLPGVARSFS